jgi:uncharacterized protein YbjT (DUF2867 family)
MQAATNNVFCILSISVALAVLMSLPGNVSAADGGVLVFGGTGRLGAPIVKLLVESGDDVTVFARPTSDRYRLDGLDVQYVVGDLLDEESVIAAFRAGSFRAVIDASARRGITDVFYDKAMLHIVKAAHDTGVRQFIYHSSVGAGDNMAQFPRADFSGMRDVLLAKGRAEQLLIDSGIGYTIIRNGLIQPDGTPATKTARLTQDKSLMGVVTRADLALLTIQCIDEAKCMNHIYHAVDPSYEIPAAFR